MKKISAFTLIFLLALSCLWLGWTFVSSLSNADPGISAAVIGVTGTLLLGVWTHYKTKEREIHSMHFVDKKNAYSIFIDLIFDVLEQSKGSTSLPEEQLLKRITAFKKELMVWGNQEVIQALNQYEEKSLQESEETNILFNADDLLKAIRKDLGHNDKNLKRGELVAMLLIVEDRKKILQKIT